MSVKEVKEDKLHLIPVSAPPCPKLTGKKHETCQGHGVLLNMTPANRLAEDIKYNPATGKVTYTGEVKEFAPLEVYDPLAGRYYWFRCDTCGHKFSVRGVARPAKKATKK